MNSPEYRRAMSGVNPSAETLKKLYGIADIRRPRRMSARKALTVLAAAVSTLIAASGAFSATTAEDAARAPREYENEELRKIVCDGFVIVADPEGEAGGGDAAFSVAYVTAACGKESEEREILIRVTDPQKGAPKAGGKGSVPDAGAAREASSDALEPNTLSVSFIIAEKP